MQRKSGLSMSNVIWNSEMNCEIIYVMKEKQPGEIPLQPDPGPPSPYQPTEPSWPITKPERMPVTDPEPAKHPTEIPPPPERQ